MKKTFVILLSLLFTVSVFAQQPTLKQSLQEEINRLQTIVNGIQDDTPTSGPVVGNAKGQALQAALDQRGVIDLEAGVTYTAASFVLSPGTTIRGHGAKLQGLGGPALYIPPSVDNVSISDVVLTSTGDQQVVRCGDNSSTTQSATSSVPLGIAFTNISIPTFRGKRGFELNCSATLTNVKVLDVWHPNALDSQAVAILNTCGPVNITGGTFVAASENIMIGGDKIKVPCVQSDITIDGATLSKPESWRTDGVNRGVKNLFEVKAGRRVTLKNSKLSGSWKAGQTGYAVLITPKNANYIQGVTLDNVTIDRVGAGFQFMGKDYNSVTPKVTSGIVVRNTHITVNSATYGGPGHLALFVDGMLDVLWDNITATFDGSSIAFADSGTPMGPFTIRNSKLPTGRYGIQAPGANYGNVGYVGREFKTVFEGNTFLVSPTLTGSGLTAFKRNYPNNTFVAQ